MDYTVRLFRSPLVYYREAWGWQVATARDVMEGDREALALLQHPPVFTFGRRVRPEHLLIDSERLAARGVEVIESDRGGDITFHGPGQLVGYPILDLRRRGLGATDYVHLLEEVLIRTLAAFDISAQRVSGRPGVWAAEAKIAAIGVRIRRGVTTHGFALNVEPDLSFFDAIVPCGLSGAQVTSMERLLGKSPGMTAVESTLALAFEQAFYASLVPAEAGEGLRPLPVTSGCAPLDGVRPAEPGALAVARGR